MGKDPEEFARPQKSTYMNENSYASRSGKLNLSNKKFRALFPELYTAKGGFLGFGKKYEYDLEASKQLFRGVDLRKFVGECIAKGDTNMAIVMKLNPLRIAVYTEDIDAIVILDFPVSFAKKYKLGIGQKMVSINTYRTMDAIAGDLQPGPKNSNYWQNVHPSIGLFLSDDLTRIRELTNMFTHAEYQEFANRAHALMSQFDIYRKGRPFDSSIPLFKFSPK